ncbi:MAG TPA: hypothetical protein VNF05_09125 [Acidimicrobiales bacterium]|nr:hypothetical protein [Acidimicrobiales bacterium]
MTGSDALGMSDNVTEADWIRERLSPWHSRLVTSVVPGGFDAYARILHPVELPLDGGPVLRWSDVSRWSGVPLHPRVQWHEIALPQTIPPTEPPWRSQGPRQGTLFFPDAEALIENLSRHTASPHECFFCLWVGYFGGAAKFVPLGSPPVHVPAPAQPSRLVELPFREYGLYEGSLAGATSLTMASRHQRQTPNLWWPADRSWCVASEIDLPWTYVGASSELIDQLLSDERLETVAASPGDPLWIDVDGWLAAVIEHAVDEILSKGSVNLHLAAGTVTAQWEPSRRRGRGTITTRSERTGGWGGGGSAVNARDPDEKRRQISLQIRRAILSLVAV